MRIIRTSQTTITPKAREELLKRKEDTFYHSDRELRHPLGIYNLSLMNIWNVFEEVLDELEKVHVEKKFQNEATAYDWDKVLLMRQEALLHRVMQHFDDCQSLLRCFYPLHPLDTKREQDENRFRKQPEITAIYNQFWNYRNYIANIINHIKHYQGMLRGIAIFNEDTTIIGYFVEHINKQGILEPHPNVHPRFKGMHTGFSFNRNLRYLFWLIYAVSELVARAIVSKSPSSLVVYENGNLENQTLKIAQRLERLPIHLFSDELALDFPEIKTNDNQGIVQLNIDLTNTKTLPVPNHRMKFVIGWVHDGVTSQVQLLYADSSTMVTTTRYAPQT